MGSPCLQVSEHQELSPGEECQCAITSPLELARNFVLLGGKLAH
jgi:hypothetical protein